ncbi:acyltransferase [Phenylobacterium sp.]|uniref:acyltransferase family protein n=1 Tax=Phenylobacterium sp. TaxID=1871053 RepID=UPI00286A31FE|nr:acyltransferase [Phenylobacterium sp.]
MHKTLADQIEATGGRSSGFDYMRIVLALAVVCWHSVATCYGHEAQFVILSGPFRSVVAIILPMFFALSGFLVAGSLERTKTLVMFLGLRAIRIFPALGVEVILSALILGPLLTSYALGAYVTDPLFLRYFRNLIGDIRYYLPGVFENNPNPGVVNGQLWTVPFELECYILLSMFAAMGVVRRRLTIVFGIAVTAGVLIVHQFIQDGGAIERNSGPIYGKCLVLCFLAGAMIYLYREKIRFSLGLCAVSAVAAVALIHIPYGDYFLPVPVAYLTVYLGLLNPRKVGFLSGADYSYGVFLYSYVIQQAVMSAAPWAREWYWNILICVPLSIVFAAASWHLVEKPALGWRVHLKTLEEVWISIKAKAPPLQAFSNWARGVKAT